MGDLIAVAMGNSQKQLLEKKENLMVGERAALVEMMKKRLGRYVLINNEQVILLDEVLMDLDDVRVFKLLQDFHFHHG